MNLNVSNVSLERFWPQRYQANLRSPTRIAAFLQTVRKLRWMPVSRTNAPIVPDQ